MFTQNLSQGNNTERAIYGMGEYLQTKYLVMVNIQNIHDFTTMKEKGKKTPQKTSNKKNHTPGISPN